MTDIAPRAEQAQAYFTDRLVQHLKTCNQCITAKRTPGMPKCSEAVYLIRQTINERHGAPSDE
jgi:hypothetical protein